MMKILIVILMFAFTVYMIEKISAVKASERDTPFRQSGANHKYYACAALIAITYLVVSTLMVFFG